MSTVSNDRAPRVILFDIDGTLIDAHNAGRRAMEGSFEAVVPGNLEAMGRVRFAGMTDPGIVRAAFQQAGLEENPERMHAVVEGYLVRIKAELDRTPPRIIDGAVASVEAALDMAGVAVGLGTGNVERGAEVKLRACGLWTRFGFGGYGSDAEARHEMLLAGRKRGAAQLGCASESCEVLVVGDTPRDVAAAHAIGARCLAVATGGYDEIALREAGADVVVSRLDGPDAMAELGV